MNQSVIDRAVNIATRAAMLGKPVKSVVWIPPTSASQDAGGTFAIDYCGPLSATDTPPWEKT